MTLSKNTPQKTPVYDVQRICDALRKTIGQLYNHPKMVELEVENPVDPYDTERSLNPLDYLHVQRRGKLSCQTVGKGLSAVLQHGYGVRDSTTNTVEFHKKINARDKPVWGLEMVSSKFLNETKPNLLYLYVYDRDNKIYLDPDSIPTWFVQLQGPALFECLDKHAAQYTASLDAPYKKEQQALKQAQKKEAQQRDKAARAAAKLMGTSPSIG